MNVVFGAALGVGSAALGFWLAARFPQLAPQSLVWRAAAPLVVSVVMHFTPIWTGSYVGLYTSIFLVTLPLLTMIWLGTLWLLQSLRDLSSV